jgi:hypothetical protein
MTFLELWNLLQEHLIEESVKVLSDSSIINAEIEVLEGLYRKKDKPKFKQELKKLKKQFMSKLVKENYKSLLSKYFPQLRNETRKTDDEFQDILFNTPEIWETFDPQMFVDFLNDFENALDYLASRNHGQNRRLRFLSKEYLKY